MTRYLLAAGLNGLGQGVLLTLLAWVLIRLQKNLSATSRHAAWLMVLVMVTSLPFLPLRLPTLSGGGSRIEAPATHDTPAEAGPSISPGTALPPSAGRTLTHVPLSHEAGGVILGVWILGTLLLAARFGIQLRGLSRIRAQSTEAPAEFRKTLDACLEEAGVQRPVALRLSDAVDVPATIGAIRPAILIPREMSARLSPGTLRRVLAHELAHVARNDFWTLLLQRFVGTIWFFHPAVRWINRRIELERELACDQRVLAFSGCSSRDYVASLLGVGDLAVAAGRSRRQRLMLPMASQLRQRVIALQKETASSRGFSFRGLLVVTSLLAVAASGIGGNLAIGISSPIGAVSPGTSLDPSSDQAPLTRATDALRSPDATVRAGAAFRLSTLRGEAAPAIPVLLELLRDETPVPRVPGETSPLWGRSGEHPVRTSPGEEALKALVYIGRPSIEPLRDAIVRQNLPADHDAVWGLNLLRDFD